MLGKIDMAGGMVDGVALSGDWCCIMVVQQNAEGSEQMVVQFTNMDAAGFLPEFLNEHDDRPAVDQLHHNYGHGGGWNDFKGFTLVKNAIGDGHFTLEYQNDPPLLERSRGKLRDELILVFDYEWVAVVQPDGAFRVARMD